MSHTNPVAIAAVSEMKPGRYPDKGNGAIVKIKG